MEDVKQEQEIKEVDVKPDSSLSSLTAIKLAAKGALVPVTESERGGKNELLPTTRARLVGEILEYIENNDDFSISDIARKLNIHWKTANDLVAEVTERMRQQDLKKIAKMRNILINAGLRMISANGKKETYTPSEMNALTSVMKDLASLQKLETQEVKTATDSKAAVSVHFNNMSMDSAMMREIEKTKEERKIVEQQQVEDDEHDEQAGTVSENDAANK
jgi:predicted transcriptional regulator